MEADSFSLRRDEYFPTDDDYRLFQDYLLLNPDAGQVMRRCGGLRKVRWPDPRRGKGKRGGLRIVYLHYQKALVLFLVYVYDKNEATDLSAEDRAYLVDMVDEYRKSKERAGG